MAVIKDLLSEKERLEIKVLADEARQKWAQKGYCDIFAILNNCSLLIRKPLQSDISGFVTFFDDHFIVILNTNRTLGHERFTGAHELYHLIYNQAILKQKKLLYKELEAEEKKAQGFAAEFLMPEDSVKESFFKLVGENIKPDNVEARHVIRLQHVFQVSYAAMLKRLIQLKLCTEKKYEFLREYGSISSTSELQRLTKQEGKDLSLITASKVTSISDEYLQFIRNNYENEKISYGKLLELLEYIQKKPEEYGYENPEAVG